MPPLMPLSTYPVALGAILVQACVARGIRLARSAICERQRHRNPEMQNRAQRKSAACT